jgi:hypothetical protein
MSAKDHEHRFTNVAGTPLPYTFCRRWGCTAAAVAATAPPKLAAALHNAIPWKDRFPQVQIVEEGNAR